MMSIEEDLDTKVKWGLSLPDVGYSKQDSTLEYIKPADNTPRVGNSAYFTPSDEPKNIDVFKEKLDFQTFTNEYIDTDQKALPVIAEVSFDEEDEELPCYEFDDDIMEEDTSISKRGTTNTLSPKRSITSFSFDDPSVLDDDFIDIGSITEAAEQTKATKRYFKQKWWLINPDRWPKRYWDNFVALMIV